MDSEFLPSKLFMKRAGVVVVLAIVIILITSSADVFRDSFSNLLSNKDEISPEAVDAYQTYKTLDTDGDGLFDWEEALFGSDITMQDTDGDSISDYVEFYTAQAIDESGFDNSIGSSTPDTGKPLTTTDIIARDLYSALQISKQQSGEITEDDMETLSQIASESIQSFDYYIFLEKDFSFTDSTEEYAIFKSKFNELSNSTPVRSEDVKRIMQAIDSEQPVPIDVLGRVKLYQDYIISHTKIPVPTKYKKEYISYVNALSKFLSSLELVARNDTDPASALGAFTKFEDSLSEYKEALIKLTDSLQ